METRAWSTDNFPFTVASTAILLKSKAKKTPNWKIDEHGLVDELKDSPIKSGVEIETIELIPMDVARRRILVFPEIRENLNANEW